MTCENQMPNHIYPQHAGVSQSPQEESSEKYASPSGGSYKRKYKRMPCTWHNRASSPTCHHLRAPSEDRDKVLNTIPRILSDTLRDPREGSNLLLLQLEVSIEH